MIYMKINRNLFKFDAEKAVEAILYVANRAKNPDIYHVLKILYFADREHLGQYGRLIYGDSYVAMRNGPVPSGAYDIVKDVRGDGLNIVGANIRGAFEVNVHMISPLRDANLEIFSDSDIECLNAAIDKYGYLSFSELKKLSHDKAYDSADDNDFISLEQFISSFPNCSPLYEHLKDPHPG